MSGLEKNYMTRVTYSNSDSVVQIAISADRTSMRFSRSIATLVFSNGIPIIFIHGQLL